MSLDLSFDRIRRPQCNLFRFHRHRSPGTTRVVTSALPPSVLHWALAGRSDDTRAQFIVSHRTSGFAGTSLKVFAAKLLTIISPFCWTERCTYHNQLQYLAGKLLLFLLAIFFFAFFWGTMFIYFHQIASGWHFLNCSLHFQNVVHFDFSKSS